MVPSAACRWGVCLAGWFVMAAGGCSCKTFAWKPIGWRTEARNPIPERFPLGSVNRAHYHAMQTNAEATDFVLNQNDFTGETTDLSPGGKDRLLEIAARMRSAPFPVVVERTMNNANPELDQERRDVVARHLANLGNPDADQRTFVATPYDRGLNSLEAEADYFTNFNFRNGLFGNGFGGGAGNGNTTVNGFGFGP